MILISVSILYHIFMESATQFIFQILILVFSVVIHEVSHGYAALALGDRTAEYAGRLTLNPIKHLDPFGSVILPLFLVFVRSPFLIGWAKPVPYNPNFLRNQTWGPALVGVAGPASNLLLALIFGLFFRITPSLSSIAPPALIENFLVISGYIVFLNILLALFNILPIPPLDGSKVLFSFISYRWQKFQLFLEQYGFFIAIAFIFLFGHWLFWTASYLFRIIAGTVLF